MGLILSRRLLHVSGSGTIGLTDRTQPGKQSQECAAMIDDSYSLFPQMAKC